MLYNKIKKRVKSNADCLLCPHFNREKKKCEGGIGKICFEYDERTMVCLDPVTKLPIKFE